MIEKFLGIILIVLGLGGAGYIYMNGAQKKATTACAPQSEEPNGVINNFSDMLSEDIYYMLKKNVMPVQAKNLQYVVYNFHSALGQKLINNQKLKLSVQPNGQYRMEIDLIDVPDEKDPAVIVQYNLFELRSNNKIWELGKTYPVSQFIKLEPAGK